MQMDQGITKYKCATIAEAEMVAACWPPDVLLAYQPVGPNIERFVAAACGSFLRPGSLRWSMMRTAVARAVEGRVRRGRHGGSVPRSRLRHAPQRRATRASRGGAVSVDRLFASRAGGSAYVRRPHPRHRSRDRARAYAKRRSQNSVRSATSLVTAGLPVPAIVTGGTPTFPLHARRADVECSPGTACSGIWDTRRCCPTWISFRPSLC